RIRPQTVCKFDRVRIRKENDEKRDIDYDLLDAPLVPSRCAVHGGVVPRLDVLPGLLDRSGSRPNEGSKRVLQRLGKSAFREFLDQLGGCRGRGRLGTIAASGDEVQERQRE